MVNARSGVPRGYQAVMPYLRVRDAANAIKFYKRVFGAEERYRLKMAGKIGHAELVIGGCVVMLSDEFPEASAVGPKALKGTSVGLTLYVDDVDKLVQKAVRAGAKLRRPVSDQFYGDRAGQIEDPFGHVWLIQTRIEKVAPKDMQKRLTAMLRAEASAAVAKRKGGRGGKKAASASGDPTAKRTSARKPTTRQAPQNKARAAKAGEARKTTAGAAKRKAAPGKAVSKRTTRATKSGDA